MLDARTDGEGLLHERDAARQKRFERIAGAVADGEHDGFGRRLVPALRVFIANGGDAAALVQHLRQARAGNALRRPTENRMRMALTTPQSLSRADVRFASIRMSCGRAEATKVRRICRRADPSCRC